MPDVQRISSVDAAFLHREKAGARVHVASVTIFEGPTPEYDELREHVETRLQLVPRFRQRLADVPLGQGRPVWVDDPHFNLRYHLRHAGLPAPGRDEQLETLAGRLFAQRLDRTKPLWELYLVTGLDGDRFALVAKSHHALVDGIEAVDITSVLFDATPDLPPSPSATGARWTPRPLPSSAELLSDALVERATQPREIARSVRALLRAPRQLTRSGRDALQATGALTFAGLRPAPPTPLNVATGPHRRYAWVDADLQELQRVKDALGGTVNDTVLSAVALALGRFLRHRGVDTEGLVLRAVVPIAVHVDGGSEVRAMWAELAVGIEDPAALHRAVRHATSEGFARTREAIGARALTQIEGFAPPTMLSQAARLQQRQRFFNLTVTNVPGPQQPLYLRGRRLCRLYPVVPLAGNHALGVAVCSYDGRLGFGLLADYDALPDLDVLVTMLEESIAALAATAAPRRRSGARRKPRASDRRPATTTST